MNKVQNRKKFGHTGGPIKGTRILARPMPHFEGQGIDGKAIIVINDNEQTFTAANVYGGNLGKNYDPAAMTHPLPTGDGLDTKMKEWTKKGYAPASFADFDVAEQVKVAKPKAQTVSA